ncbi:MAG: hypothetical protein QW051_03800 [Candidatus Aenigmatarchaeota archaeon]
MPRDIRLSGFSLTKYGTRKKKVVETILQKGLIGLTTKGTKQILLLGVNGSYVERIIVYDVLTDNILTDFTSTTVNNFWTFRKLTFSPIGSFVLLKGIYFKYNVDTKTYSVISLPYPDDTYAVKFTKWLDNSFINCCRQHIVEFNLNGTQLRKLDLPFTVERYIDYQDKIYFCRDSYNKFYEFDIPSFTYREITVPFNLTSNLGNPLARIKDTNYLHLWDNSGKKLYKFDLTTNTTTLVKDFAGYDFISPGVSDTWFSNDGKILIMSVPDIVNRYYRELWFYDIENDTLSRLSFVQYPFMVLEDKDTRKFLIVDVPKGYVSFVYDYLQDKVIGVIGNYPWYPFYTDGELVLTL